MALSLGLIDRAFDAGVSDPALYYRRYPKVQWRPKGGYEIQCTPQELAAVISNIRSYLPGKRMLCIGSESLGAERFMAENMSIKEIDYIGTALKRNLDEVDGTGITIKKVSQPEGQYDLITVFGKPSMSIDQIMDFTKINGFIVCLGIGTASKQPELRTFWMGMRKKFMTMLQTGARDYETGVGIVKVLYGKTKIAPPNAPIEPETVMVASGKGVEKDIDALMDQEEKQSATIVDSEAPYGRKKDGSPKKKPGRG